MRGTGRDGPFNHIGCEVMTVENQVRKPLGRKSYGHIPHLPGSRMGPGDHKCHDGQARIATWKRRDKYDMVIITEKLDGSNVGIARMDGKILPITRAGYLASSSPWEQHWMFANWVFAQQDRFMSILQDGERLCGEWLAQAHGTRYDLWHEPFVLFDIMYGSARCSYLEIRKRALQAGLVMPSVISYGEPMPIDTVMKILSNGGLHGAIDEPEGAVWRIEDKGKFDFMVKYVRPNKQDGQYLPEVSGKEPVWNWRA